MIVQLLVIVLFCLTGLNLVRFALYSCSASAELLVALMVWVAEPMTSTLGWDCRDWDLSFVRACDTQHSFRTIQTS